jgi:hypothetical protein
MEIVVPEVSLNAEIFLYKIAYSKYDAVSEMF